MKTLKPTYRIVYRTGTSLSCRWDLLPDVYESRTNAQVAAEYACRRLRASLALVKTQREIDVIGLPIGWEPQMVDWDLDTVAYVQGEYTEWRSHKF